MKPIRPGRGLVPGPGQQADVAEDLLAGERPRRARLVLELGVEQLGHQVVGGVLGAPGDVVRERLELGRAVVLGLVRNAFLESQALVEVVPDRLLVLLRDTEQHPDDPHRHELAQVRDEIEAARADEGVERLRAEGPHLGLECLHLLRREDPGEQASVEVVIRRVLEEDGPGRDLHSGLDDLEDRASSRDVGLPVEHGRVDVLPATQREELVLLVPIQRRLVAQPLPHRVRVRVDGEVVGVVVDPGLTGHSHVATSLARPPATPAT